MRLALRAAFLGERHDLLDRGVRDRGLAASTLTDLPELDQTVPANRVRQFATVVRDTDTVAAIVAFAAPSAAISKALARTTSRCAPDCDRANDFNTSRCPSVTVNAGTGLLMPEIIPIHCQLFAGHTTSERHIVDLKRGDYEELDQLAVVEPFAKAAYRVNRVEDIGRGIARAIRTAVSGRPGGVYLDIPAAVLGEVVDAAVGGTSLHRIVDPAHASCPRPKR